jgi:hypothetical protein
MKPPLMNDTPEDAWCKGRTAGGQGLARAANPYLIGGELALDWADGWLQRAPWP